jgi:hypothetical protein
MSIALSVNRIFRLRIDVLLALLRVRPNAHMFLAIYKRNFEAVL